MFRRRIASRACAAAAVLTFAAAGCRSEPAEPPESRAPVAAPPSSPPSAPAQPPAATRADSRPAPVGYSGPLPPLPQVPYPPARSPEVVRAVYEFAARSPEVLRYVPCFCGCEHHGHVGNDDCFVAGRDASGKPRWEMHGYV